MKRRRLFTSLAAIVLVMIMLFACVSCNKEEAASEPTAVKSEEDTAVNDAAEDSTEAEQVESTHLTILVLETGVQWNTCPDNEIAKEIEKQTGVTFEFIESDDAKYKVMIESGDLTDIIRTDYKQFGNQLIEGNHIIPLDDLLETNGQDIKNNLTNAINYLKENASNGQNKLYYVPVQVSGESTIAYKTDIGATIRWDYYKEIGAPAINSVDELLDALEQMQKNHPETEDGKAVYAVSSFNDWAAGMWAYDMMTFFLNGDQRGVGAAMASLDTLETKEKYKDPSSNYWQSIELFYKANQRGILDPDAMIMKFDDYTQKATEGRILYGPAEWAMGSFNQEHPDSAEGYIVIPVGGYSWTTGISAIGWSGKRYAITTNCETPDKAMDLLNYMASYEGARTMYSGIEGIHWDMVDGVPTLKESTVELKKTGGEELVKSGILLEGNFIGLNGGVINPNDGYPLNLFLTPEVFSLSQTTLEGDFCDFYGIDYPMEVFMEKNETGEIVGFNSSFDTDTAFALATLPSGTLPDEIKTIEADVTALAVKYAAKLVYAENDAEYERLKTEFFTALDEETEYAKYLEYCQTEWESRLVAGGLK